MMKVTLSPTIMLSYVSVNDFPVALKVEPFYVNWVRVRVKWWQIDTYTDVRLAFSADRKTCISNGIVNWASDYWETYPEVFAALKIYAQMISAVLETENKVSV